MERIRPGTEAPLFTATTFDGRTIALEKWVGSKTWLCFYRYGNCPLCAHHAFEISHRYSELGLDRIQICAIFESARIKFGKLNDRKYPQFPLISDPRGTLYDLYGVEKQLSAVFRPSVGIAWIRAALAGFFQGPLDGPVSRVPAHFLLREDLTVHAAHYGRTIADQIPWEVVEDFLALPAVEVPTVKGTGKPRRESA